MEVGVAGKGLYHGGTGRREIGLRVHLELFELLKGKVARFRTTHGNVMVKPVSRVAHRRTHHFVQFVRSAACVAVKDDRVEAARVRSTQLGIPDGHVKVEVRCAVPGLAYNVFVLHQAICADLVDVVLKLFSVLFRYCKRSVFCVLQDCA